MEIKVLNFIVRVISRVDELKCYVTDY